MKSASTRRPLTVIAASLAIVWMACAAPAAAQQREGSFDRNLTVTGTVDLSVHSGSGQIRVQPGPAGAVRVAARIKSDGSWTASDTDIEQRIKSIEQNPPVEQQGNTIRIGRFADESQARNLSISYDITVPADAKVAARSGSGGIVIGAVKGAVEANSGSGSIQVDGASALEARTGSGSIRAGGVAGAVSVSSGSGSITVAQTGSGAVSASAASGSVTLTGVNGAVSANTASGGISITGRPAGEWSLHAASGSVSLALPADAAFTLEARSSAGGVSCTHPVTSSGDPDTHRLSGTVRGGGPLVKISTASGGIRIR